MRVMGELNRAGLNRVALVSVGGDEPVSVDRAEIAGTGAALAFHVALIAALSIEPCPCRQACPSRRRWRSISSTRSALTAAAPTPIAARRRRARRPKSADAPSPTQPARRAQPPTPLPPRRGSTPTPAPPRRRQRATGRADAGRARPGPHRAGPSRARLVPRRARRGSATISSRASAEAPARRRAERRRADLQRRRQGRRRPGDRRADPSPARDASATLATGANRIRVALNLQPVPRRPAERRAAGDPHQFGRSTMTTRQYEQSGRGPGDRQIYRECAPAAPARRSLPDARRRLGQHQHDLSRPMRFPMIRTALPCSPCSPPRRRARRRTSRPRRGRHRRRQRQVERRDRGPGHARRGRGRRRARPPDRRRDRLRPALDRAVHAARAERHRQLQLRPGGRARPMASGAARARPRWCRAMSRRAADGRITVGCYLHDVTAGRELAHQGYAVAAGRLAPRRAQMRRPGLLPACRASSRSSTRASSMSPKPAPRTTASSASRSWIRTAPTIAI